MKSSARKAVRPRRKTTAENDAKPSSGLFPIVGIGASAGGLEAFSELLRYLPEKTGMAFVLVQHLDPKHGSALQEILARTTKIPVTEVTQGVVVQPDHAYVIPANTSLTIKNGMLQLGGPTAQERFYVVVFQDAVRKPEVAEDKGKAGKMVKVARPAAPEAEHLKRETNQLREQLRSLIEEHESTSEEFKSAHEEVLSANEELQSTNEELETAKEELQSTNEELTTLNEEMQNRNAELGSANNDLLNLLGHVDIPVVMVSNDLRIRRFTPPAQKLLNLLPGDIGRRLGEIRPNLDVDDLETLAREAIRHAAPQERQVRTNQGGWQMLYVRPYKTWDNRIEGAVISLQDVDALKRTLDQTREYADTIVESAREPILVLDTKLQVTGANPAFYRAFEVTPAETEGRQIYQLGNGQWNIPKLRELLEEIVPRNSRVDDFEMRHDFSHLGPREMLLNARLVELQPGHPFILLAIEDVTQKRQKGAA